jgi:Flp pilus assembly protein TadD
MIHTDGGRHQAFFQLSFIPQSLTLSHPFSSPSLPLDWNFSAEPLPANGVTSMPSVDQLYDEAIDLQQAGKLEEAIGKLESLAVDHPDYALCHAALSVFYGKLGRYDEAVEHAGRVCQLEPDDPFSYMAMSLICQRAGRIPEAEQALGISMEKQWAAQRSANG